MSSDILNQMQDVKSQMDQFRLYLQIQQGRADDYKAQIENKTKNAPQSFNRISPLRGPKVVDKSRTTPKKTNQKKNFYTPINLPVISSTPKTKKRDDISNLLSTNDSSSSDEELDSFLKEHRKSSGAQSPFKKYHFSSDSKASLSKYSISADPSEKGSSKADDISDSDSTEILKDEIIFSNSNSDSSDSTSLHVRSSRSDKKGKSRKNDISSANKLKILRSVKLVDEIMSESDKKKKKVTKSKLKISKSFAVPYSGSYEEGEVYKIEEEDPANDFTDTDSDFTEFDNFVPPVADEIDDQAPKTNNDKDLKEKVQDSEKVNQNENTENTELNNEEIIIKAKNIPDVEVPTVDLEFLKDDENETKNASNESDKESLNVLFDEMQTICTILDNEEESG